MYAGYLEEGDTCGGKNCSGKMEFPQVENCSCHINPPCHSCTSVKLTCDKCGFQPDEPEYKEISVAPGLAMREYKPRPLDKTKIDWRSRMHTNSTMIKEGVYPEDKTREDVEKEVQGTFGGRFEYFGNGKFKYIAYTD